MRRSIQVAYLKVRGHRDHTAIGKCYYQGTHVEKNLTIAKEYALKAVQHGDDSGFDLLSRIAEDSNEKAESHYFQGLKFEKKKNYSQAIEAFKLALDCGHQSATQNIKNIIDNYTDPKKPIKTYKKLSQTNPVFFINIAEIYVQHEIVNGNLVDESNNVIDDNVQDTFDQFKRAAENSISQAIAGLGLIGNKHSTAALILAKNYHQGTTANIDSAIAFYELAIQLGDTSTALYLGNLHHQGDQGIKKDFSKAVHYYFIAAERKHREALNMLEENKGNLTNEHLFRLGQIYHDTYQDPSKALVYFKELNDINYPNALAEISQMTNTHVEHAFQLAELYAQQKDVKQQKNAIKYYLLAMKQGSTKSISILDHYKNQLTTDDQFDIALYHRDVFKKPELALRHLKILADQSHKKAKEELDKMIQNTDHAFYLANLYREENNSEQQSKAITYYFLIASQGYQPALQVLFDIRNQLSQVLLFKLGQICQNNLKNISWALVCFKQLTDKNVTDGFTALNKLLDKHPNQIFELAMLYEVEQEDFHPNAIRYYLRAANECKNRNALNILTKRMNEMDNDALIKLADIYSTVFNDLNAQARCLKLATDRGSANAKNRLDKLASQNTSIAFEIGKLYLHEDQKDTAFKYYLISAKKDIQALTILNKNWALLNNQIRFAVATIYMENSNFRSAFDCFKFLFQENTAYVSSIFDQIVNIDKSFAFELAEFYAQQKLPSPVSIKYYLVAAETGHQEALHCLEDRAAHLTHQERFTLATIYRNLFQDNLAAIHHFKFLAEQNNSRALTEMDAIALKDAECAYELGKNYREIKPAEAIKYFLFAARSGKADALKYLEEMLEHLDDKSQIQLSDIYINIFNNRDQGLKWLKRLVDRNYQPAINKLFALIKNNNYFAFQLANLYAEEIPSNKQQAKAYYFIATKSMHKEALARLEKMIDELDDTELFNLASLCHKNFKKDAEALFYFKRLADKNHTSAMNEMNEMANKNPNLAYLLAETYNQDGDDAKEKAYNYYCMAALRNHQGAFQYLEKMAKADDILAQFALSQYFIKKNETNEAIDWSLRAADQGHIFANEFLINHNFTEEQYLKIAKHYEQKDDISTVPISIHFYEKAFNLKSKDAALYLGYFLLVDHSELNIKQDNEKAFEYLLKAHEYGHPDALTSLECNASLPQHEAQISELYEKQGDQHHAKKWLEQAEENGFKKNRHIKKQPQFSSIFNLFANQSQQTKTENSKTYHYSY